MDAQYTGNIIAEARKAKGFTQREIAEKLHVTISAVSKWERGLNYPDLSLMELLADLLEIPVVQLLGLENKPTEQVVRDMAEISRKERETMNRNLWIRVDLISGVFILFLILSTVILIAGRKMDGNLPEFINTWLVHFSPLLLGLGAWVLGIGAVLSGRNTSLDRWKNYSAASAGCCAAALYFPALMMDLEVRERDFSAIEDTAWAIHYAAVVLLLGTLLLNLGAWIVNRRTEKREL